MAMIPGLTISQEATICTIFRSYGSEYEFFYYGSRVSGKFSAVSDLDILIKGKCEVPPSTLEELKETCDNSALPFIVNFTDFHSITETFYRSIEHDLVRIKL
ncbi:MAG: nucleotidyltransferase domain-containing protein [Puniceicoccales bacterium]|jgi:predicted nucleotidyltransferase|nr:nucleotidyltransferase domain-containing protein [Puniceicoccales bacterium]